MFVLGHFAVFGFGDGPLNFLAGGFFLGLLPLEIFLLFCHVAGRSAVSLECGSATRGTNEISISDILDLLMSVTPWADQYLFPKLPVPELGTGPITLRVVRALNPRFPSLSEDEFSDVLDQAATLVQDHFALLLTPIPAIQYAAGRNYNLPDAPGTPEILSVGIAEFLVDPGIANAPNRS